MKADPWAQLRLLDLQEVDTRLGQLAHRKRTLPEHAEVASLEKRASALRDKVVAVETELSDLEREQRRADADVDQVRARAKRDQDLLDSGTITVPRQLEDLQHEIGSLKRRQSELEDVELEIMERVEDSKSRVEAARAERDEVAATLATTKAKLAELVRDVDQETKRVSEERARIAPEIPEALLKIYDKLRADLGGMGAAPLHRGSCQGCRMQLTPVDIGRIREAPSDEVVRCEECRRILVRTAESGL